MFRDPRSGERRWPCRAGQARGNDLLSIESIYGSHADRDHKVNDFVSQTEATVRHGRVLVPVFALGH